MAPERAQYPPELPLSLQERRGLKENVYGVRRWVLAALVVAALPACTSGRDAPEVSGATVPTEATTSTTMSVEQEVEQAYLRAFDIYVKAVRDLDDSRLSEAYAGDALQLRLDEIGDLKAAGTPVRYEVENRTIDVRLEREGRAVLEVRYLNHSVLLNGQGEPIEPDPNEQLVVQYVMEQRDSKWLVVEIG